MTVGCLRHQRRVESALGIATSALLLLAGGCASLANTPAQDVAWTRWGICHTQAPGTEIRNVQLDGRIRFWYVVPRRPPSHARLSAPGGEHRAGAPRGHRGLVAARCLNAR